MQKWTRKELESLGAAKRKERKSFQERHFLNQRSSYRLARTLFGEKFLSTKRKTSPTQRVTTTKMKFLRCTEKRSPRKE